MKTNRWRGRAGQSLVEMAMVLPVLAFLTFGLLDFGRAYYFQVSVTNSAREGARVGILNIYTGPQNPSCSISNSYATCPVQTDANIVTDASNRVDKWLSGDPANQNYYVTVNVKYDFRLFTPLMQQLVGNPIHMSVSVQMRTNY